MKNRAIKIVASLLLVISMLFALTSCTIEFSLNDIFDLFNQGAEPKTEEQHGSISAANLEELLKSLPEYDGRPWVYVNDGQPFFTTEEITANSYESYGDLDSLGRCTVCIASIGKDLMPTEKRGSISSVKPTGWKQAQYECISTKDLYNRCHLIGWQLTGENANKKNLITGTRYLNIDGMVDFENMTADYIKETNNHVMYRVTPIFEGNNLLASGVLMEAYSVEDQGEAICFCVYCYNVQPGVVLDYATGESHLAE